jgi:ribonuclease VapC
VIVDTSAFIAMSFDGTDGDRFAALIRSRPYAVSAASLVEMEIVIRGRRGDKALNELRKMLDSTRAEILPVDEAQARIASDAYARFGRGSGSPAKLNYGDCFSYALAIARDEPLLFKGDDFIHTDVRVATP